MKQKSCKSRWHLICNVIIWLNVNNIKGKLTGVQHHYVSCWKLCCNLLCRLNPNSISLSLALRKIDFVRSLLHCRMSSSSFQHVDKMKCSLYFTSNDDERCSWIAKMNFSSFWKGVIVEGERKNSNWLMFAHAFFLAIKQLWMQLNEIQS